MKKLFYIALLILTSCSAPKNLIYFADVEGGTDHSVTQEYDNRIQRDDLLSITVSSQTPELTIPFNGQLATVETQNIVSKDFNGYLVDSNGEIIFPILGRLKVLGMTHGELAAMIEKRIIDGNYIKDPTVSVKLKNFKISVLGEVKIPGLKEVSSERITILDAIGLAGDMTIYGVRDKVSVIREENGKRQVAFVDLSNKEIFNSPYYYLRPNDIVYVRPNDKQQKTSTSNAYLWPSILSATSLLVSLVNFLTR